MPYYRRVGDVPRKRHTVHRDPTVDRLLEELMGVEGFSGASSLLYHRRSPSAVVAHRGRPTATNRRPRPNHPLRPHHLRTATLAAPAPTRACAAATAARQRRRAHRVRPARPTRARCYRNAVGDELVYVQRGRGRARERVRPPRGRRRRLRRGARRSTTHRWVVDADRAELADHRVDRPRRRARPATSPPRASSSRARRTASATCAAPDGEPLRRGRRGRADVLVRTRAGLSRPRARRTTRSTSSAGTAALYPWALSHPRLRADRRQPPPAAAGPPDLRRARTSSCARSCPGRSTSIPTRSRSRTTTPTSTPTRCCSTATATS